MIESRHIDFQSSRNTLLPMKYSLLITFTEWNTKRTISQVDYDIMRLITFPEFPVVDYGR